MHASLQRDRLKELPATVQGVATAAADGSFEDLKRLRQIIFVDKTHTSEAALPVIYQCLDPAEIPTVDVGAPCRAVPVAVLALKTLRTTIVPPGAASDLWPRVWAWFQFLDTKRVNIRGMKLVVLRCACRFRREERVPLMNSTQGFYTIVGCLWASLPYETDAELDSLRFVFALLATVDMSNLVEVMEGAGGSFEILARLVIRQITLTSGSEDQHITQLRLDLLRDVLIFATNVAAVADDGIGPQNAARSLVECLVMQGVLKMIVSMAKLSLTTEPDPAPALSRCFQFLRALFGLRNMHAVIPAAVTGGLLGCIVLCAHRPPLGMTHHHLVSLLMMNLSASTVYAEVLLTIKDSLAGIAEILAEVTPELEKSVVFRSWTYFVRLVEQRLEILQSILMTPRRTCDNLACNKKDWKDAFQKCSRCKHFYYCSKECQSADWHAGGHRAACAAYSEHSLSEQHNLTSLDRTFMRAVLDQEYASCKAEIFDQTIKCIRSHPDAGYFVVFDYVSDGPFRVQVHSLGEESMALETLRKSGVEWENIVARAARSRGCITIHVIRVREGDAGRYWVIPLRSTTGQVHERLRRIAAEFPSVEGEDLPGYFVTLDPAQVSARLDHVTAELDAIADQELPNYLTTLDTLAYRAWDADAMH